MASSSAPSLFSSDPTLAEDNSSYQETISSSGSALVGVGEPVLKDSLRYWEKQSPTYDGVLGGYGSGLVQRVDYHGSREFLLHILPELHTIQAHTLLPLFSDVVLLEPVESLLRVAASQGTASKMYSGNDSKLPYEKRKWSGIADFSKSVTFLRGTLQAFDPARPSRTSTPWGRVGYSHRRFIDDNSGFDVVWCQWCLSYMMDADLIAFLKRSRRALRKGGAIGVKENVCKDGKGGVPDKRFHQVDSSVTRSDLYWKKIFRDAGLTLFHERVQDGLPKGLFAVKM